MRYQLSFAYINKCHHFLQRSTSHLNFDIMNTPYMNTFGFVAFNCPQPTPSIWGVSAKSTLTPGKNETFKSPLLIRKHVISYRLGKQCLNYSTIFCTLNLIFHSRSVCHKKNVQREFLDGEKALQAEVSKLKQLLKKILRNYQNLFQ